MMFSIKHSINSLGKQLILLSSFGLLIPSLAQACSVCFSATGRSLFAYYATTIALTTLPLALVGGLAYWFYRSMQDPSQPHEVVQPSPATSHQALPASSLNSDK